MDAQKVEQAAGNLRNQGKGYQAVEKYLEAKELYAKAGDLKRVAGCQHMVGVSYKIESNLEKAMPAYKQAIELYKEAGDALGPGRVLRDMGIMYAYHDDLEKAESLLLQRSSLA